MAMFIELDKQYHSGIVINIYGDRVSLVQGFKKPDEDEPTMRWCKPQGASKNLPMGIHFKDVEQAILYLSAIAEFLSKGEEGEAPF